MTSLSSKEKPLSIAIVVFSAIVVGLVALLFFVVKLDVNLPFDPVILPRFHAMLNFGVSVLLISSFFFIKRKNVKAHRICNVSALVLSALFLVSYVVYHSAAESTKFGDIDGNGLLSVAELAEVGVMRYIYLVVLLTHIPLAAIILPIILFTFMWAFLGKFESHRKVARFTMPIWLYVSITGVLIYLMISPYY